MYTVYICSRSSFGRCPEKYKKNMISQAGISGVRSPTRVPQSSPRGRESGTVGWSVGTQFIVENPVDRGDRSKPRCFLDADHCKRWYNCELQLSWKCHWKCGKRVNQRRRSLKTGAVVLGGPCAALQPQTRCASRLRATMQTAYELGVRKQARGQSQGAGTPSP